jgi:hypothetical protein
MTAGYVRLVGREETNVTDVGRKEKLGTNKLQLVEELAPGGESSPAGTG